MWEGALAFPTNIDLMGLSEISTLITPKHPNFKWTQTDKMQTISNSINNDIKCPGYQLFFPPGYSPYSSYPFQIHAETNYPWILQLDGQQLYLQSTSCQGGTLNIPCISCAKLARNEVIQGILQQINDGAKEHTLWKWLSHTQLIEVAT
jgi:hypothetical protein